MPEQPDMFGGQPKTDEPIELRPCVRWFAEQMELKLRKHDRTRGVRGWVTDPIEELTERIDDELSELKDSLWERESPSIVISEAVDIGNFAMMVADLARHEGEQSYAAKREPTEETDR